MARKRKPAAKTGAKRAPRRGKKAATLAQSEVPGTSESPAPQTTVDQIPPPSEPPKAPTEDPPPAEPQTSQPQPAGPPNSFPTVVLHKKFGKYRCLFNNDDATKKYDVGSDSETNSSVEIRVVDPCASSESDSNAALEIQSDTNSGACSSPMDNSTNSGPVSPSIITPTTMSEISQLTGIPQTYEIPPAYEIPPTCEIPLPAENIEFNDNIELELVPLPPPLETEIRDKPEGPDNAIEIMDDPPVHEIPHQDIPLPPTDEGPEQVVYDVGDDEEEMITIVQIVEDDNDMENPEYSYDIKIDSPQRQTELGSVTDELERKRRDTEFQQHFEKLNLSNTAERSPMEFSHNNTASPCITPDFTKDSFESMTRPDPSLTPISTLSDDSNSSRVTEQNQDSSESSPTGVRRSSRIKTISNLKQKTKGYGLVKTPLKKALITQTKLKLEELGSDSQEKPPEFGPGNAPNSPSFPVPSDMPVKVKSRWRRSSELEMGANSPASSPLASPNLPQRLRPIAEVQPLPEEEQPVVPLTKEAYEKIIQERMSQYQHLDENEYLCERMISRDTKKMICDCFLTKEELDRGEMACGEDCLNRLLMIECNSRCPVGERCTNRRFQKRENAPLKVFYADKKGCGVEANVDIAAGEFLMEYVGEVLDYDQFYKRAQTYSEDNNLHHYFMSLKGDTVIDATLKGNISRFINHSCEPNAETQKWTVNGELRIGFFSKRDIPAGQEITFDYQFQRFGKVAQRCYCGAENCRGWIGAEPDSDDDEEEEEEDISTSKSGSGLSEESSATDATAEQPAVRVRKPKRERKYKPKAKDLVQDADIEEDLEVLGRTGVKNQSQTLRLSRTVVRAKTRRAQTALLRLLRDADLPCRRLFLDYRGLRLLAPWCTDAPLDFRLEMLLTVDRLPIPNKTMVQESRFFTIVERWLSATDVPPDNVFIDESTGLSIELPNGLAQDGAPVDRAKDNAAILEKVKDLSKQLLERWSSLKEVFKIPKKERIQQMKEHERQANVERRAADSSGSRDRERDRREERDRERERERDRDRDRDRDRYRERDRERERERDRERERERERDERDRRKRRGSPEGRRSIRLSERVLAAVPPMSKEERRRAFAEAAAAAERGRAQHGDHHHYHYWPHDSFPQMFGAGMMGNMGGGSVGVVGDLPPDWRPPAPAPDFAPPFFPGPQPFCMPHPNMMNMGNMGGMPGMGNMVGMPGMGNMGGMPAMGNMGGIGGFNMSGFVFGQQISGAVPFPQSQPPPGAMPVDPAQQACPAPAQAAPDPGAVVLPSLWRSATDARGRTYYYHVKRRQPQWTPPTPPPPEDSSEEEEESVAAVDVMRRPKGKLVEGVNGIYEVIKEDAHNGLIPDHALVSVKPRKRRPGLVSERPISPRTEEDKLAGRLEVKRYKQTKEKLRRRRERLLSRVRLLAAGKRAANTGDVKIDLMESESDSDADSDEGAILATPAELAIVARAGNRELAAAAETAEPATIAPDVVDVTVEAPVPAATVTVVDSEESARKIKEQFRSSMARVMVHHLNPYRHSEAKCGRITSTADFKHLARKLTHFVMLKELKHCRSVEELVVTDSVRSKAKMFVKKYMAKFGPVYKRPPEEAD